MKISYYHCNQCGKEITAFGSCRYIGGRIGKPDARTLCSEKCIKAHLDGWIAEIKKGDNHE